VPAQIISGFLGPSAARARRGPEMLGPPWPIESDPFAEARGAAVPLPGVHADGLALAPANVLVLVWLAGLVGRRVAGASHGRVRVIRAEG